MTDDELIERVRRTLRTEAAAVTPRPENQAGDHYAAPLAPVSRLPFRPRWPLAVAVAAAVAAGVTLVALNWPGGGSSRIGLVSPGPSTSVTPTTVPPTRPAPVGLPVPTTLAPVVTTLPVPTTVAAPTPLAASFTPDAVTFVSPRDGWIVGSERCGSVSCVAMAHTTDGGYTWSAAPAPMATLAAAPPPGGRNVSVRFADFEDGWIYALNPSRLWSTHDGGAHWTRVPIAGLASDAENIAMEAGAGYVRIAVMSASTDTVHVESSPVGSDAWTDTDTGVPTGAGPVPATQLVLQGTAGWVLENDRTVVGGVRLNGAGQWVAWTPPGQTANGSANLAASSATDLVAVGQEGTWGPAHNLPAGATIPSTWLFRSSDGGTSFQAVGALPATLAEQGAASPSPATVVVDGSLNGSNAPTGVLTASFDGGQHWQTVLQVPANLAWYDLGFTTQTQGVLIGSNASGSTFYMTRDGGHHWAAVRL